MATNRFYSKTKLAPADIVTSHIIFFCTNFLYPPRGILKTVKNLYLLLPFMVNKDAYKIKLPKILTKFD